MFIRLFSFVYLRGKKFSFTCLKFKINFCEKEKITSEKMEIRKKKRKVDNIVRSSGALTENLKRMKLDNTRAWETEASSLPETRLEYLTKTQEKLSSQLKNERDPEKASQLRNQLSQLSVQRKRLRTKRKQNQYAPKEWNLDKETVVDYERFVINRGKEHSKDEKEKEKNHENCSPGTENQLCISDVFDRDTEETMKQKTLRHVHEMVRSYLIRDKGSKALLNSSIMSPEFMRSASNEIHDINQIVPGQFPIIRRLLANHPPDGKMDKLVPLVERMQPMKRADDERRGEGAPLWEWNPNDPSGIPACWTHKLFMKGDTKRDCVGTWILGSSHRMYERPVHENGRKTNGIHVKPVGPVLPAYFPSSDMEEKKDRNGRTIKCYKFGNEWPDSYCLMCFRHNARIIYGKNRDYLNQVGEKPEKKVREKRKKPIKGSPINRNDGDHRYDIEFFLYNLVSEGEYCACDTFVDPEAGFPLNIVSNQRNMYELCRDPETRKRYFKQHYPYPDHNVDPVFH